VKSKNRVLITGASSGIGKECAIEAAKRGYELILTARRKEKLKELKKQLKKEFRVKVHIKKLDVRDYSKVRKLGKELKKLSLVPNILINNAGLAVGLEPFFEGEKSDWDRMIDTNLKGLLYVSRVVVPLMKKYHSDNGHIINIGSLAGRQVYPGGNVYNATKFGVHALTEAMNIDLVHTNIKASCIAPGAVETDFSLVRFKGDEAKAKAVYEADKTLEAKDIADAIFYILTRPPHVNIQLLTLNATSQRNAYIAKKNQN